MGVRKLESGVAACVVLLSPSQLDQSFGMALAKQGFPYCELQTTFWNFSSSSLILIQVSASEDGKSLDQEIGLTEAGHILFPTELPGINMVRCG